MTASVTPIHLGTARLALMRVDESTDETAARVRVTLAWDGDEHAGTSDGSPSDRRRPALVAAATLDAVAFLGGGFTLVDTATTRVGGADVALVAVDDLEDGRRLFGTAQMEADNRQVAFARATLDAINRILPHQA
ncbi:MAG: hypothetical protein QY307_05395 [Acidimicrobiia bacterium]|nr:MAG: hypothetical protein QY307_05395 [Acidimicrobiia bacterium]